MSSIERAMSKMAGGAEPTEPASDATVTLSTPSPAQTFDKLAAKEDFSNVTATAVSPAVEADPAVERTIPPALEVRSEAPAVAPPSGIKSSNYLKIDLERLAAAGFLVPNQPTTRQSEEFQHIKRRLLGNMVPGMMQSARPTNLILITSSVPGEGKTFTSTNLALSIAMEVDHTILLIDTDIMKRDLSKVFGVVDYPGLFDLLADHKLKLQDLLVRTSIPNLVILPAGSRRDGSTELLASVRMKELTDELATRYRDRVVLFDSPPVLATTTATALAPLVGQVILVAESGSTKHETIREALARLDHVRITGVILNKSKQQSTPGYDYYGSYYHTR